jgi:hypothetical protein
MQNLPIFIFCLQIYSLQCAEIASKADKHEKQNGNPHKLITGMNCGNSNSAKKTPTEYASNIFFNSILMPPAAAENHSNKSKKKHTSINPTFAEINPITKAPVAESMSIDLLFLDNPFLGPILQSNKNSANKNQKKKTMTIIPTSTTTAAPKNHDLALHTHFLSNPFFGSLLLAHQQPTKTTTTTEKFHTLSKPDEHNITISRAEIESIFHFENKTATPLVYLPDNSFTPKPPLSKNITDEDIDNLFDFGMEVTTINSVGNGTEEGDLDNRISPNALKALVG